MKTNRLSFGLAVFPMALFMIWQSGSCKTASTKTTNQDPKRVAAGVWGGSNVRLNVTEDVGHLEFACAHGQITQPMVLNSDGTFSVKGTFTAESFGPTRQDNSPPDQPALYEGNIKDQSMTLVITLTETKKTIGTFNLEFGRGASIRKCK